MAYPDRMSRRREKTRDHIATVASTLFERHGYETVTMEGIAAEADVARGTLYNHFPVKEAVLAHWMHTRLERDLEPLMQEVLSGTGFVPRLMALLKASAGWWENNRQYAVPYIRYRFQEVHDGQGKHFSHDTTMTVYVRLIADAQRANEIRADASPDRFARYLHFLYLCAMMTWLEDAEASLGEEFMNALAFFLDGAGSRSSNRNP